MATTIKQTEAAPESYPDVSELDLSDAAAAIDPAVVWQRIESYVAHRWSPRAVEFIVEGCGEWVPPLSPASIEAVQVWSRSGTWEAVSLTPSPLGGYYLPATGPYRFTGTAGPGTSPISAPAAVMEAWRRLAEYMASDPSEQPGSRSESMTIGSITTSTDRSPAWLAMALQHSGAADLLRPYRRAS